MISHLLNTYHNSTKNIDIFIITQDVKRALRESQVQSGLLTVFLPLSAAGIVVLENDSVIHHELKDTLASFIGNPEGGRPARRSGTGYNSAHLRAAFLPPSFCIPIHQGKLLLGAWQDVLVYDFDDRVGRREVQVHVLGMGAEKK